MHNPFVLPTKDYKRDLNILKHYVDDSAKYLQLMTGKPLEVCVDFIKKSVRPGGQFEFKDPDIQYLERGDNGDREEKVGKLSQYLNSAIKNNELIAPTLTIMLPPTKKKSLLVDFIDEGVKARNVAKKAMFAAERAGDKPLQIIKKTEQTNKKLNNNSISGAHVSASTPLYNKTAHNTLTSNCRSTSGYGNANNEKFLSGNRHYWSVAITKNNIISIVNHSDYVAIEATMKRHGIRPPTVEETMQCITFSTDLYWENPQEIRKIEFLISQLSDLERSAVVYTGDLYHLKQFNEKVVFDLITKLSLRVDAIHPDPEGFLKSVREDYFLLAIDICPKEMEGKDLDKIKGTHAHHIVASTVQNIMNVLDDYTDLIKTFWVTPNIPASVAVFPDSIRRVAVTSDTDSTIFTVQDWVLWHQGSVGFDDVCSAVSATMIFLASQTITHVLARMSANFGIEESRLHQIAMKNEYKFDIFVPTQVAKHYYALISRQESNLHAEYKTEIKGVHLKSSNAPKVVMKEAEKMMVFIMMSIVEGKKINMKQILKWIADIERSVIESIKRGSYEYFRFGQIKPADAYTKAAEVSNYAQYILWQEVFAMKSGETPPPPYRSVKVSTELGSPASTKEWLRSMKDRELADRIQAWLTKNNRSAMLNTFMLPEQTVSSKGIPEEILEAVNVRKIILDTTGVFYLVLETLHFAMLNKKNTRLVSDQY